MKLMRSAIWRWRYLPMPRSWAQTKRWSSCSVTLRCFRTMSRSLQRSLDDEDVQPCERW